MHRSVDLRLPRDISSQNLVSFAFITTQISNRQLLNMDTRSKARGFITWHLMCNFEGYTSKGLFRGLVLRFWKFPQIEEPAVEVYGKRGLCSTTVTSVSFCTRLGTHLYKNNVTRTKTWEANYAAMSPKTAHTHNSRYCTKCVGMGRQRDDKYTARTGSNMDAINFLVHSNSNCVGARFYIKPGGQTKRKLMQTWIPQKANSQFVAPIVVKSSEVLDRNHVTNFI